MEKYIMNNDIERKPLNILLFSFDWRNIYKSNPGEIIEKLERDRLNPGFNYFLSINWSSEGYYKKISEHVSTVHLKAYIGRFRLIYDLVGIILTPLLLKKHSFKPDVVLVYDFPSLLNSIFVKLFFKSRVMIMVTNIPRNLIKTRRMRSARSFYQIASEFLGRYILDMALVISYVTQDYVRSIGISNNKIRTFQPNTILRDESFIASSQKGLIRKKYNISKDKRILLSVGRLEKEKNFPKLIELFSEIKNDNLVLIVVGHGSMELALKSLVKKLNIVDKVIFAGFIERAEIWNFYKDADVFILLSTSEGLGLVFWEAMYMRVPVIGNKIEGILETIGDHEKRGFFWQEGDSAQVLESKIKRCVERQQDVLEMLERANSYVEDKIKSKMSFNEIIR